MYPLTSKTYSTVEVLSIDRLFSAVTLLGKRRRTVSPNRLLLRRPYALPRGLSQKPIA